MTSSENSSSIFLFYTKQEYHSYILQNRSSTSDEIYVARNETALESGLFFFWENWKRLHIRMALVATSFSQKINITHKETSQDTSFLPSILVRLVFWWQQSLPTKMFREKRQPRWKLTRIHNSTYLRYNKIKRRASYSFSWQFWQ